MKQVPFGFVFLLHHAANILLLLHKPVTSTEYNEAHDLIAIDLKRTASSTDMMLSKDASFDCWLNALSKLEYQSSSSSSSSFSKNDEDDQYEHKVKLSPGGNFCASMRSGTGSQLDALAFELTKCEYERFSEPLPMNCSLQGRIDSGTNNEASLRDCMMSLSKETWLAVWTAFTQYKLSSYNLCTKLTDELMLHRQKEAAYHLEKTMVDMEGKMDQVLQKADNQFEKRIDLMGNRMEEMKNDMGRDVKRMMNLEIENVERLHQEMKGVLDKADDKLEETTRKLEDSFENIIMEFYKKSGLQGMLDTIDNVKSGSFFYPGWWTDVIMFNRFLTVLSIVVFLTNYTRIRRARSMIMILIAFEFLAELNLNHFVSDDQLDHSMREKIINSLRMYDFFAYFIIMAITFLGSFFIKDTHSYTGEEGRNTQSIITQVNTTLEVIKMQIEMDREARRRDDQEWKHQAMMNLHESQKKELLKQSQPYRYATPEFDLQRFISPTPSRYPNFTIQRDRSLLGSGQRLQFSEVENDNALVMGRETVNTLTPKEAEEVIEYETASEGGNLFPGPSPIPISCQGDVFERSCKRLKKSKIITEEKSLKKRKGSDSEGDNKHPRSFSKKQKKS